MARKIVKKSSAKLYGDKFVKVSDTGDTQFYIRHFGHVGTEKNPNIELAVVAQIQDLEGAVSEDELPEEGNFQLNITLVPYEKYISPKLIVSATEDSSSDNVLVDVVEYMGGLNYEPQEKFIFKTAKAAEKYLYSKELNDLISGHGILSGFILDKHYNRIGQTNWDRLAYMTGESSKFEKGGSVGGKRKIVKKLPVKGFVDGGAADLSTKEKAEMYVWIDKALLREDLGSKHDLYKWFAEKFKKTAEQTEDIIDNGWAVSRGAGKHSKFAKGGGVDKFKVGDNVKIAYISDDSKHNGKTGEITWLNDYNYYPKGDESVVVKRTQAEITYGDGRVEEVSDIYREGSGLVSPVVKVGKMAKGGGVGEPKEIKKRLEYLRKELRAERISYEELAELQSLSKYIDTGDVELLQAAGVPEFDYEWLVTLKGKDGDEIDEEVEAKTEDEAMNKAEKKHEGSKALGVVQLTDDNGKIEYAKGGAVAEKLTEERDGDTIVLKRGKKVYAEVSYNKNPDYKWTLFINPKAKSGMALSGFKSSADAIKRANELNGEFNKAVSGLYAKGGEIRRFDRHEEMGSDTRDDVMSAITKLKMLDGDYGSLENYLYGLFDGYDYSQTDRCKEEMQKLKSESRNVHDKIEGIFDKVSKYNFGSVNEEFAKGGGVASNEEYQLLFANQSADSKVKYRVVRETPMYLFLQEITKEPNFIFRVHKKTLSVKGIKEGKNGYQWDVPSAISLKKIPSGEYAKGGSVGGKRKVVKKWYSSSKPDEKTYVMYDFARSEEQAKNMLRDLHEGSPIAHKSTSQGGEYNIYVKRGSVLWREKGGSVSGKRKIVKKGKAKDNKFCVTLYNRADDEVIATKEYPTKDEALAVARKMKHSNKEYVQAWEKDDEGEYGSTGTPIYNTFEKGGSVSGKRKIVKESGGVSSESQKKKIEEIKQAHEKLNHKSADYREYMEKFGQAKYSELTPTEINSIHKWMSEKGYIDAKAAGKEDHSSHYEKIAGHEFYIDKVKKEYWLLMNGAPVFKNADKALVVRQKGVIKGILLSVEGKRKVIKKK